MIVVIVKTFIYKCGVLYKDDVTMSTQETLKNIDQERLKDKIVELEAINQNTNNLLREAFTRITELEQQKKDETIISDTTVQPHVYAQK